MNKTLILGLVVVAINVFVDGIQVNENKKQLSGDEDENVAKDLIPAEQFYDGPGFYDHDRGFSFDQRRYGNRWHGHRPAGRRLGSHSWGGHRSGGHSRGSYHGSGGYDGSDESGEFDGGNRFNEGNSEINVALDARGGFDEDNNEGKSGTK